MTEETTTSTQGNPQVQVKFFTKQSQYVVTDTPILVPANLRRYGLSEIINHLLGNEKPTPFDFLIEGKLLRSSLFDYLNQSGLSTENVMQIEYIPSSLPPQGLPTYQTDDWISSVKVIPESSLFLVGCYDGVVKVFNQSGDVAMNIDAFSVPVKAVDYMYQQESNTVTVFSGGLGQTVIAHQIDVDESNASPLFETVGHKGSIEDITVTHDNSLFATASFDSTINLYTTSTPASSDPTSAAESHKSKKRKSDKQLKTKTPINSLTGHVGAVSSVVFQQSSNNQMTLVSGGWDHSIRIWDVENSVNTETMMCEKVVNSVDFSSLNNLIVSGHSDRVIRLWDPRAEVSTLTKSTFAYHTNAVTAVKFSPSSSYNFASCSFDGSIKLWDMRASNPLFTLSIPPKSSSANEDGSETKPKEEKSKVLSVDWGQNGLVIAGGEECVLGIWDVKGMKSGNDNVGK
ncbi:WD40-repeat-containing domain protein [Paraphysoderma sedebokerense]|nr:WD40-repeat-containing domain protein [Paraphysoderma sedebokerense]KAI9142608.1 WD40-repeat-containing domain protein [Paraphysoderma sedebokerense]